MSDGRHAGWPDTPPEPLSDPASAPAPARTASAGTGAPTNAAAATPSAAPSGAVLGFLALAGPMVVSRLGLAAMGIADGVMLARYSTEQLALHGLADPLVGRLFEVSMAFLIAGMALAAQARAGGREQQLQVGQVWHQALLLAVGCGLAGALLGAFGTPLLALAGQGPALARGAGPVIGVLCLGMVPALLAMATAGVLEAIGRPVVVVVAVVVANGLNIALNSVLIWGVDTLLLPGGLQLHIPALGAVGAAWSTTGVRVVLAVALLAAAWWLPQRVQFGLRRSYTRRDWQAGAEQRARGLSAAGGVAVLAGVGLGLPVMAGWLGTQSVAEMTLVFLALAPCMVVAWGLSDAAGLQIANQLGQHGGARQLRRSGLLIGACSAAILVLLCAAILVSPQALLAVLTPDAVLANRVLALLPLAMLAVVLDGLSFVCINALRSLGELRRPFLLQLWFGLALLALAAALGFGAGWGVAGLLLAQVLAAVGRSVALARLYLRCAGALAATAAPAANTSTTPHTTPHTGLHAGAPQQAIQHTKPA